MEKTRTSLLQTKIKPFKRSLRSNSRGFTLIEILLVLVILSLLASLAVSKSSAIFRASVNSGVRRFASVVRYAYDQAVLTGRLHRIVLDMDKQTWTVESTDPGTLPVDKARMGLAPEGLREEDRVGKDPSFQPATNNATASLPGGVAIVEVSSWRMGEGKKYNKGKVSIYAFPNGFLDEAKVVLAEAGKEEAQRFVITTQSLTGRVKVETENPKP